MPNTTVKPNQSIFDIALQEYGIAEAAFDIVAANGLDLNVDLKVNQELVLPEVAGADTEVVEYIKSEGIVIATDKILDSEGMELPLKIILIEIRNEISGGDGYIGIMVTGGAKPYSYSWKDSDGVQVSSSQNLNGASAGTYSITATDDKGQQVSLVDLIVSAGDDNVYLVDEFGNFITDENGQPIVA